MDDIISQFLALPLISIVEHVVAHRTINSVINKLLEIVSILEEKKNVFQKNALAYPDSFFQSLKCIPISDQIFFISTLLRISPHKGSSYIGLATLLGIQLQVLLLLDEPIATYLFFRNVVTDDDFDKYLSSKPEAFANKLPLLKTRTDNIKALAVKCRIELMHSTHATDMYLYNSLCRTQAFPEIMEDDLTWLKLQFTEQRFRFEDLTPFKHNPLIDMAAQFGAIKCFRYLLINEYPVSSTTMTKAVQGHNMEIVQLLREKGIALDHTHLKLAINSFNQDVFEFLAHDFDFIHSDVINTICSVGNFHALFFVQELTKLKQKPDKASATCNAVCQYLLETFGERNHYLHDKLAAVTDTPTTHSESLLLACICDSPNYLFSHAKHDPTDILELAIRFQARNIINHLGKKIAPFRLIPAGVQFVQTLERQSFSRDFISIVFRHGDLKIINHVIMGVAIDLRILTFAIDSGCIVVFKHLLDLALEIPEGTLYAVAKRIEKTGPFSEQNYGNIQMLRSLLSKRKFEQRTLDVALVFCYSNIKAIQILQRHGANINGDYYNCHTVLTYCLWKTNSQHAMTAVESIIRHGADPNRRIIARPLGRNYSGFEDLEASLLAALKTVDNVDTSYFITPLMVAIKKHDCKVISLLISMGASVFIPDTSANMTLLDIALMIYKPKPDIIQILVDAGAPTQKIHILYHYINNNDIPRLKAYLDQGIDPNSHDISSNTPLGTAIRANNYDAAALLFEYGASATGQITYRLGSTYPIIAATHSLHIDMVDLIIPHADVNVIANGESAITTIVKLGNNNSTECFTILEHLLKAGANPNLNTKSNPLVEAVNVNNMAMISLLLKHGADPNSKDAKGANAMIAVVSSEAGPKVKHEQFALMLQHGGDIKTQTLLARACGSSPEIARQILADGADPNDSFGGQTALALALCSCDDQLVKLLLDAGADSNKPSLESNTQSPKTPGSREEKYKIAPGVYPMHVAAKYGNAERVALLLAHNANPNQATETTKITPLVTALDNINRYEIMNIIHTLIKGGADPNQGLTLVLNELVQRFDHRAAAGHDTSLEGLLLNFLLENGASPNSLDSLNKNALSYIVFSSLVDFDTRKRFFDKLVAVGGRILGTNKVLYTAISLGNVAFVQECISAGANVDGTDEKHRPLAECMEQSSKNRAEIVSLLLDNGANPNATICIDTMYHAPRTVSILLYAIASRLTSVVDHLLAKGADVNFNDSLSLSITWYDEDVTLRLIELGADINAYTKPPHPLILAMDKKKERVVKAMLTKGVDSTNVLTEACSMSRNDVVRILLETGVDPNKPDTRGMFPLAADGMSDGIFKMLIAAGADPKHPDVLYQAVRNDSVYTVTRLLKHGADPNAPNSQNKRPIDLISESTFRHKANYNDIRTLLLLYSKNTKWALPSDGEHMLINPQSKPSLDGWAGHE